MPWEEYDNWAAGNAASTFYAETLKDAAERPIRDAGRKKIITPGSRSGKHRHLAEECLYVVEGRGYDIHVDCDVEITDTYHWKPQDKEQRFEWEAGDMIYIPPNTIHQHFNADPERPARLISATNRIYKYSGLNDLQQIENAPEYEPGAKLDGEIIKRYLQPKAATR